MKKTKIVPWMCPNCKNVNRKNGFYCEKCGTRNNSNLWMMVENGK